MDKSDSIYIGIGRAIRNGRTKAGLTQKELAKRVGLTRTSITHIEAGEHRIQVHILYFIAEAVGVSADSLLVPMEQRERTLCSICGIDLKEIYGELGDNHLLSGDHIIPKDSKAALGEWDNGLQLRVCPNCHSIIDANPGLTAEKLVKRIRKIKETQAQKIAV